MLSLEIDEKWAVLYDPDRNNRPIEWLRYGERVNFGTDNLHTALFYALLEARNARPS